jgi:predicted adenine nucleotide alpha hydrolase (AANH) superfamily ATPase
MTENREILLHVCCAPCSTSVVERLIGHGYKVILFFSNSNISPEEEYLKRLAETRRLSEIIHLDLIEDAYDHLSWIRHIRGFENEPEGGGRCLKCFEFTLGRASSRAEILKCLGFTTTLTVSRYKSSRNIFEAGRRYVKFIPMDFKKQDGYGRGLELSKQFNLYRQGYCGCEFSIR